MTVQGGSLVDLRTGGLVVHMAAALAKAAVNGRETCVTTPKPKHGSSMVTCPVNKSHLNSGKIEQNQLNKCEIEQFHLEQVHF